jgi:hypothetical protein
MSSRNPCLLAVLDLSSQARLEVVYQLECRYTLCNSAAIGSHLIIVPRGFRQPKSCLDLPVRTSRMLFTNQVYFGRLTL